ncbi:TPA: hypothetical protein ACGO9Z_001525 [Streptococcus suis]|uniref:hypothetical protein n=1 Tax=Streptococcus TaxID=1301 RepID=UPI0013BEA3DD|nr:hypothetical protein [Streptococcus suis]NJW38392.1 hypothetical protein [Streptococcus suis]NQG19220.1 hypothetical protein [Streptococcus suis]NQH32832.1 hypothetical protein [Streptococcus suis]NQH96008.1 hypothetical protein [Streptococcus suis]NQL61204.1 hypothetical protein [Streptococcus suis]
MLKDLLILFFLGNILCLIGYFVKNQVLLKRILYGIGGLLIASPFLVLAYFLYAIFL